VKFEGDAVVYNNKNNGNQANMVLEKDDLGNNNAVIQTTATGLGENAHIGVYVAGDDSTNPYKEHGTRGLPFGTWDTSSENLDKFTNDRVSGLFGMSYSITGETSSDSLIYWGCFICKIVDTDGNENVFTSIQDAVTFAETSDKITDKTAAIEMLVDYVLPEVDAVTIAGADTITLTTAKKTADLPTGQKYGYVGSNDDGIATITRGFTGTSMIINAGSLTVANLTLDGGSTADTKQTCNTNGGIINCNMTTSSLTLNSGATLQNTETTATYDTNNVIVSGHGGAIYSTGAIIINEGVAFNNCKAGGNGGAIDTSDSGSAGTITINGTTAKPVTFTDCTAAASGGAIYAWASSLTMTNCSILNDAVTGNNAGWVGGGIGFGGGTATLENVTITGLKAYQSGAAVYVYGEDSTMTFKGNTSITGNSITNTASTDGGAVNAEYASNKLYFTGNVVIYDNTTDSQQKNVVLDFDSNDVINTLDDGLGSKAHIGIYTTDTVISGSKTIRSEHGLEKMPFGNSNPFDRTVSVIVDGKSKDVADYSDQYLSCFTNDLDETLRGVRDHVDDAKIYWAKIICKITDNNDNLLYLDAAHTQPAVFGMLGNDEQGVGNPGAATYYLKSGLLYTNTGDSYTTVDAATNKPVFKLKMLVDYTMPDYKGANFITKATVTLTTAEKPAVCDDGYPYVGISDYAVIKANQNYGPSGNTSRQSVLVVKGGTTLTLTNITLDGGATVDAATGSVTGKSSRDHGGVINIRNSNGGNTVYIKEGTTIRNGYTNNGGGAILNWSKLYMEDGVIENSYANGGDAGGGVCVYGGATFEMSGGTIRNCVAARGGGVYIKQGTFTMTGGTISGCYAKTDYGGAVYIAADNRVFNLSGGTIEGNKAPTGAGIYIAESEGKAGKLNISGNPSFGSGNFSTTATASGSTNAGAAYPNGRQDIYIAGTGDPLTSINVTGAITSGDGTIWVWADNVNHYDMLKQFAVLDDSLTKTEGGNKVIDTTKITEDALENTMKAFRNAQPDSLTNCGGDYLTGQKGEVITNIYWTGGFDVVFMKTDGFGDGLAGATFTLYTDETCNTPFEMTFVGSTPTTDDGKRSTTTSSDGTKTYKDKAGNTVTLFKGEVLLSKVAPKIYYMKETQAPDGFELDTTVYQVTVDSTGELQIHRKSSDAATSYDVEVYKKVTRTITDGQTTQDVLQYIIQNESLMKRRVVLRKVVQNSYESLAGARFRIFRADLTEVTDGQPVYASGDSLPTGKNIGDSKGYYESVDSGVYFVNQLPHGFYYLVEIAAPAGAASSNKDKAFELRVEDNMVRQVATEKHISATETDPVLYTLYAKISSTPVTP